MKYVRLNRIFDISANVMLALGMIYFAVFATVIFPNITMNAINGNQEIDSLTGAIGVALGSALAVVVASIILCIIALIGIIAVIVSVVLSIRGEKYVKSLDTGNNRRKYIVVSTISGILRGIVCIVAILFVFSFTLHYLPVSILSSLGAICIIVSAVFKYKILKAPLNDAQHPTVDG